MAERKGSAGSDLSELTSRMETCQKEYQHLKTKKKTLETELMQLKGELSSSESRKSALKQCIKIREFERKMQK